MNLIDSRNPHRTDMDSDEGNSSSLQEDTAQSSVSLVGNGNVISKFPIKSVQNQMVNSDSVDNHPTSSSTSSHSTDNTVPMDNWSSKPLLEIGSLYWANPANFECLQDVTFEVGSEKVTVKAHRFILFTRCQFFKEEFQKNASLRVIPYPKLDPGGFKRTLEFIYTDNIDLSGSDPEEIIHIQEAAKLFALDELERKCLTSLQLQITNDNAVETLRLAQGRNDQRLEDLARNHISRHIVDIFASQRFLQMSEDALCTLLDLDDWELPEIEVFYNVKKWAMAKDALPRSRKVLNLGMGKAFYRIRLPLMSKDEFYQQFSVTKHASLFRDEELQAFADHFCSPRKAVSKNLHRFVARPRGKTSTTTTITMIAEVEEETVTKVPPEESEDDDLEDSEEVASSSAVPIPDEEEGEEFVDQPAAKRARCENVQAVDTVVTQTVGQFVDSLEKGGGTQNIQGINQNLQLLPSSVPDHPNPSQFHLRRESKKEFSSASEFKKFVEENTEKFDRLLFFDKTGNEEFSNDTDHNLGILLGQKIDILIHFDDCKVFEICHKEDSPSLLINLVKCGQRIIENVGGIPFKKIAFSEFELEQAVHKYSLEDKIQCDFLENVVIRQMNQLDPVFLFKSSSLREVIWNDLDANNMLCGEKLLNQNEHLRKLCVRLKGRFWLPNSPKCQRASLTELCLDLKKPIIPCPGPDQELDNNFPKMYPSLTKIRLEGHMIEPLFFYNILRIETLKWLLVGQIKLTAKMAALSARVQQRAPAETWYEKEETDVYSFLSKVIHFDPKLERVCPTTFVLEKKERGHGVNEPGPSRLMNPLLGPLDPSKWTGKRLTVETKRGFIAEQDFKDYSNNQFCPNNETWVEWSSVPNDNKERRKKTN